MRKLIRSKIPQIAEQNGNRKDMTLINFSEDNLSELFQLFKHKIVEEAKEVLQTKNDIDLKYEIIDLLQAIDEFMVLKNITDEELETIKKAKNFTNGNFICPADDDDLSYSVYILEQKDRTDVS